MIERDGKGVDLPGTGVAGSKVDKRLVVFTDVSFGFKVMGVGALEVPLALVSDELELLFSSVDCSSLQI